MYGIGAGAAEKCQQLEPWQPVCLQHTCLQIHYNTDTNYNTDTTTYTNTKTYAKALFNTNTNSWGLERLFAYQTLALPYTCQLYYILTEAALLHHTSLYSILLYKTLIILSYTLEYTSIFSVIIYNYASYPLLYSTIRRSSQLG